MAMIDEYYTWIFFGYHSDDLKSGSGKHIIAVCDECGKYRALRMYQYRDLCLGCSNAGKTTTVLERILLTNISARYQKQCRVENTV